MEKEFYTINELATMTGFTTRSLRNFIQMGHLSGEKIDGIWQFTADQIAFFIGNPNIAPGIRTKNNAVVYDFLADTEKKTNSICTILDFVMTQEETSECSEFFCNAVNQYGGSNARMKMEKYGENVRIILSGPEDFVKDTLDAWYK